MGRTWKNATNGFTSDLRFEARMWLAAERLRNNMDAAEFRSLTFLKYISDSFEEHCARQPDIGNLVDLVGPIWLDGEGNGDSRFVPVEALA